MRKIIWFLSFIVILMVNVIITEAASAKTYTVSPGDNIFRISLNHQITVEELKEWNELSSETIQPGQQLQVAPDGIAEEWNMETLSQKITNVLAKIVDEPKAQAKETVATATTASNNAESAEPSRSTADNIAKEFFVEATAYTAYCNGCSGITKTGQDLRNNPHLKVIAVDPNVIPLGTKVHVDGYGYAIAGDIGGAIKGNRIDVFIPTKNEAFKWGRKDVKIKILE